MLRLSVLTLLSESVVMGKTKNTISNASSGNRTRAARVAGEHSTTEPTMLLTFCWRKIDMGKQYHKIENLMI